MTAPALDEGIVDAENPWPGLASFREIDAEFFYGRASEIDELHRMVTRERVTLLFGATGLGKTSLLQAGLLPIVRRDRLLPVRVRLDFTEQGSLAAQVQRALIRAAQAALLDVPTLREGESLWGMLHARGRNIKNGVGQTVVPLLAFDQLEEIFTVGAGHPDRAAFLEELACLVEDYAPTVVTRALEEEPERAADFDFQHSAYHLLLSLREDFMAELDALRHTMPTVMQNRYHLRPFDRQKAREVVERPGIDLVDPAAIDEIVEFVARRPARARLPGSEGSGGSIDPSILSVVCRELNNERRARHLPRVTSDLLKVVGEEILTALYTRSLERLPPGERAPALRFIEDHLVTASGFRDAELQADAETALGKETLKSLVDSRLLRLAQREEDVWVELTHDVLLPVVTASRDARKEHEAKAAADEQRRALERRLKQSRRRQRLTMGAVVVMIGLLAGVVVAATALGKRQRTLDTLLTDTSLERARSASAVALLPQVAYLVRSRPQNKIARALLAGLLTYGNWPLPRQPHQQKAGFTYLECSHQEQMCATGSEDGAVDIWDPRTGKPRRITKLKPDNTWVNFSANGRRLLVSSEHGHFEVWDTSSWKRVGESIELHQKVNEPAISRDGDYVVIPAPERARIIVWRPGQPIDSFKVETSRAHIGTRMSSSGYLATSVNEGRISLWKIHAGGVPKAPLWTRTGPARQDLRAILLVDVSEDGHAIGVFGRFLRVWDASGELINDLAESTAITGATLSRDGRWLAWVTQGRGAQLRPIGPDLPPKTLAHDEGIRDMAFSRDSRLLMTRIQKGDAVIWDVATGDNLGQIPSGGLSPYDWLGDHAVAAASFDGRFQVWDIRPSAALPETRFEPAPFTVRTRFLDDDRIVGVWTAPGSCTAMGGVVVRRWRRGALGDEARADGYQSIVAPALSPDGTRLATVHCLDPESKEPTYAPSLHTLWGPTDERPLPRAQAWINAVTFSPDGKYFASTSEKGQVNVWNVDQVKKTVQDNNPENVLEKGSEAVTVSLSNGARKVAWTSNLKMPLLHDVETNQDIVGLERSEIVSGATLSANGNLLATFADNSIRVWSVKGPKAKETAWLQEAAPVDRVAFGHGDRWLVSLRDDGRVRLWDIETGRTLGRPYPHWEAVLDASLSPNGKHLVSASRDGLVRVWDVVIPAPEDAEMLADLAVALAGRSWNPKKNVVEPIEDATRFEIFDRVKQLSAPGAHDTDGKRLVRWFLDDRAKRTISPFSPVTIDQARAQLGALPPEQHDAVVRALGGAASVLAR